MFCVSSVIINNLCVTPWLANFSGKAYSLTAQGAFDKLLIKKVKILKYDEIVEKSLVKRLTIVIVVIVVIEMITPVLVAVIGLDNVGQVVEGILTDRTTLIHLSNVLSIHMQVKNVLPLCSEHA